MKVTMLLCDAAQSVAGKLHILGGGWSVTGPDPSPSAIAMLIQVPWDVASETHRFTLELLDADGVPVEVPTPDGPRTLRVDGEIETGRPPGVKPGTPLDFAAAITIPPQPLQPGNRYEWRLTINDETRSDWTLPFSVRPRQP